MPRLKRQTPILSRKNSGDALTRQKAPLHLRFSFPYHIFRTGFVREFEAMVPY